MDQHIVMFKSDIVLLEALNSFRDRELDYSMCCEKSIIQNITSFMTGFLFSGSERNWECDSGSYSIFGYLYVLMRREEMEKHKLKGRSELWNPHVLIRIYAHSNDEARAVFMSYLDKINEIVASGEYEMMDDEPEEMHISKMLEAIRPRPGIYLGDVSLELMVKAVEGFCLRNPHSQKLFDGFQVFTEKRYNEPNMHGYKWGRIIRAFSYSDRDALDVFFKLWDKFIQSENKTEGKNKR